MLRNGVLIDATERDELLLRALRAYHGKEPCFFNYRGQPELNGPVYNVGTVYSIDNIDGKRRVVTATNTQIRKTVKVSFDDVTLVDQIAAP